MNTLKYLFRGSYSLLVTYWICYSLPLLFCKLCLFILSKNSVEFLSFFWLFEFLRLNIIAIQILIVYGIGYAVICCSLKNPIGFWGVVAILIVALNMVILPLNLTGVTISENELTRQAQNEIQSMNAGLPQRIDPATTLNSVKLTNRKLQYSFTIDAEYANKIDFDRLKKKGDLEGCKMIQLYLEKKVVQLVELNFSTPTGTKSFTTTKDDCIKVDFR
jgi:ABC-type multidrug transport system fused ATPase/permease subunit